MAKSKDTSYSKGKRWGFAVAKSQLGTGKLGVHKVDKAMQTCSRNARSGSKSVRLNQNERNAYKGIADGMYDAIKLSEKQFSSKKKTSIPKKSSGIKKKTSKKKPFQYNYQTRIPGSYTVDGRFEPD